MKVDLLIHVVAGDQVGINRWKTPLLDIESAVVTDSKCTDDAGTVKAPNLCTRVGLVTNHVIHTVNIQLTADNFLHETGNRDPIMLIFSVHQGKQPLQTLFS